MFHNKIINCALKMHSMAGKFLKYSLCYGFNKREIRKLVSKVLLNKLYTFVKVAVFPIKSWETHKT